MRFERLRVGLLKPNGYNPNRMTDGQFAALKLTIEKEGFCGVILVNSVGKRFVIVDGEHRWRAARALGLKDVPCLIGNFHENQARALTVKMNQIHGYWSAPELVSLLEELPESLAELGFSDQEFASELERALDMVGVGSKIRESVGEEAPSARCREHRYTGFMLTSAQDRLLERALTRASCAESRKGKNMSRSAALEKVLRSYMRSCS
jgi:ParB-like chromosome segregation protein Spo0J